jgi:hypothetical protein
MRSFKLTVTPRHHDRDKMDGPARALTSSRSLRSLALRLLCSLFVAYRSFLLSIHTMPETGRILAAAILNSDSVNFLKESSHVCFWCSSRARRLDYTSVSSARRAFKLSIISLISAHTHGPSESLIIQSSLLTK